MPNWAFSYYDEDSEYWFFPWTPTQKPVLYITEEAAKEAAQKFTESTGKETRVFTYPRQ